MSHIGGLNKPTYELYKVLKEKHETGGRMTREELLEIHSMLECTHHRKFSYKELTEDQKFNNASSWLNGAIARLIRRGWLGLTFKKDIIECESDEFVREANISMKEPRDLIEMKEKIDKWMEDHPEDRGKILCQI